MKWKEWRNQTRFSSGSDDEVTTFILQHKMLRCALTLCCRGLLSCHWPTVDGRVTSTAAGLSGWCYTTISGVFTVANISSTALLAISNVQNNMLAQLGELGELGEANFQLQSSETILKTLKKTLKDFTVQKKERSGDRWHQMNNKMTNNEWPRPKKTSCV